MALIGIHYSNGDKGSVNVLNIIKMTDLDLEMAAARLDKRNMTETQIEETLAVIGQGRTAIHMNDGSVIYARESQETVRHKANSLMYPEKGHKFPGFDKDKKTAGDKMSAGDALRAASNAPEGPSIRPPLD